MAALVAEAVAAAGLVVSGHVQLLAEDAPPDRVRAAVDALYDDADSDVVVVVRIPTVGGPDAVLQDAVAQRAARSGRTTVACIYDLHGLTAELTARDDDGREWTVPAYSTPEDAALALGHAARYARWRDGDRGRPLHPEGAETARRPAGSSRAGSPREASGDGALALDSDRTAQLLATVGVRRAAVDPRARRGRGRRRRGADRLAGGAQDDRRRRCATARTSAECASTSPTRPSCARTWRRCSRSPRGSGRPTGTSPWRCRRWRRTASACVVRSVEDPLFGPIISFGLAGDASDLLGDVAYGVPPLTDVDVSELVRTARAAPRLFGYRGLPALDVAALEDLIARVAVLADDLPGAALAGAQPGGRLRARRGGPRRPRLGVPRGPRGRHPTPAEGVTLCALAGHAPPRWEDGRVPAAAPALHHDLHRAGYYPELVVDVLDVALADEEVVAHLVHPETTFDAAEVRRHVTVLVLTPTRLSSPTSTTTRPTPSTRRRPRRPPPRRCRWRSSRRSR